ncbi:hypothetical protein CONPUDRAFT_163701 [Coniophora puteana RWD-64-598 SS2]|uniref:P-loop containing nucleoside triphosphate hydrolase protein n=1 Tax=Coniophora puteana (strain RWD-64-598) TaxID=741705 RepID=A0A5M3MVE8_CONPW|nr:uncharacterized protein CONPUDRAFT_163701 [Coniophora puteana RWD-64-598 SS2]EIW82561.1 hypothetical protein CONPUDRAFT_163701 [Coniophora puteana RWD-64-598 SS2]
MGYHLPRILAPQSGTIDWPRMRKFLKDVKRDGAIPSDHYSHDHLNEQKDIPIENEAFVKWQNIFQELSSKPGNEDVVWGLIDGFLLYWDKEVISNLDVRIFLRVSHDVLKQRRHERHGYHTAVQSDPEGTLWRDPPGYWEQIVWPAYEDAHRDVFEDGNLETGRPTGKVQDLVLFENEKMSMTDVVGVCCEVLQKKLQGSNI